MRPWKYPVKCNICEQTLEEIFSDSLTDTPCVYLNQEREVSVATEMRVQYLESLVDSIVIRDDDHNPIVILELYFCAISKAVLKARFECAEPSYGTKIF